MRIGYQPSTHHAAEVITMDKGWWLAGLKPYGVDAIQEHQFPTGPPEMPPMLAGDLDIDYVGIDPPITAIA